MTRPRRHRDFRTVPADQLRALRNDIPIEALIVEELRLPSKMSEGVFRFLCPSCSEFDTRCCDRTNLARCFRCRRNFNTLDLTMLVRKVRFLEAVDLLAALLIEHRRTRPAESRGS